MTVDTIGSAIQLYRRTATTRSALVLLAANAVPIVGVLFLGWSLLTILVLFWLENGIVGFWNILKINLARGTTVPVLPPLPDAAAFAATGDVAKAERLQKDWQRARDAQLRNAARSSGDVGATPGFVKVFGSSTASSVGRVALSLFFLVHYGMFWFVHGIFVFALPAFGNGFGVDSGVDPFGTVEWGSVLIGGVALFLSHGASFLFNYIGRGEYITASPSGQMGAVYGRVVVLHLTIIFGAFAIAAVGSPIGALLILVILKTAFDLGLHLRERRAADARIPANTTFGQVVRDKPSLETPAQEPPAEPRSTNVP